MDGGEPVELSDSQRQTLLELARGAIVDGVAGGEKPEPELAEFDEALGRPGASFVTISRHGSLRGCVGSLEAKQPLVVDVARNAWSSALRDPRFSPLEPGELDDLAISISVLGPSEPLECRTEADLLAQLKPGVDGLVLEEADRRATFLPSVWQKIPDPAEFLVHLKRKAGLADDYWSESVRFERYEVESWGESSR